MSNDSNPWSVPAPQEPGYPSSQGSASYPNFQQSASYPQQQVAYPAGQQSASYPAGQQGGAFGDTGATAASYPTNQPSAAYAGADPNQGFAPQPPLQAPMQPRQASGLGKLFDFGVRETATPDVSKLFLILSLITSIAMWLIPAICLFVLSSKVSDLLHLAGQSGGNDFTIYAILQLFLGWIPALGFFIFCRMATEFFLRDAAAKQSH